ncbi:MAG: TetR family transcriptional regulator [Gammaproteobacteria bacterium HGW-Gammaproteobacteria-14]|nr:MAG: TetR family transcriptional regulator [Gammaproteobacteria bacterium HGW-Gammaproteobacteria-14]
MRRTKEDAEKTRLKVIEAALKLFSRNGYSQTTLAMIATEAGYSRGPIYWHFKNKDELYEAVIAYSQQPLEALVSQAREETNPLQAIDNFVDAWFRLLVEDRWYRQSFEILLNKTEFTDSMARTIRRERQLTRAIINMFSHRLADIDLPEKNQKTDATADNLGILCYTYLMGITQSWLFNPRLFSLGELQPLFRERFRIMVGLTDR